MTRRVKLGARLVGDPLGESLDLGATRGKEHSGKPSRTTHHLRDTQSLFPKKKWNFNPKNYAFRGQNGPIFTGDLSPTSKRRVHERGVSRELQRACKITSAARERITKNRVRTREKAGKRDRNKYLP